MDQDYSVDSIVWHKDIDGLYWTGKLYKGGVRVGIMGNYYESDERALRKEDQLILVGLAQCIQCGRVEQSRDAWTLCSDGCKSDYELT